MLSSTKATALVDELFVDTWRLSVRVKKSNRVIFNQYVEPGMLCHICSNFPLGRILRKSDEC